MGSGAAAWRGRTWPCQPVCARPRRCVIAEDELASAAPSCPGRCEDRDAWLSIYSTFQEEQKQWCDPNAPRAAATEQQQPQLQQEEEVGGQEEKVQQQQQQQEEAQQQEAEQQEAEQQEAEQQEQQQGKKGKGGRRGGPKKQLV